MIKPFIAVIGERNSGKSTVIRSLTGCETRGFRGFVLDGATRREMLVIASSPQELTLPPAQLRTFLQQAAGRRRVIGCVIALQPTRTNRRLLGVLREARRNRFSLYIFILDPGYNAGRGSAPVFGPVIVAVRGARITATLTRLDGRRFAHLNAVRIRQRAGIP